MSVGARMLPELDQAAQRMPFDQFGRYHMLREAIDACRKQLGIERLSVLDVGGIFFEHSGEATLPIMPFLPQDEVKVLDIVECNLQNYIKGDGTALDFADQSFDLVVSCDTLEHIPRPLRQSFWNELLRVAKHGVIVLAPFGTPAVETAEDVLFLYIKNELEIVQKQLQEHKQYRLPRLQEWLEFLDKHQIHAKAFPTGYLPAWFGMMLLKHMLMRSGDLEVQAALDYFYNLQFFPTERRNPAYRHLIIAEHTSGLVAAVDEALTPTLMPDMDDPSAAWGQTMLPLLQIFNQRQVFMEQSRASNRLDDLRQHYETHLNQAHQKYETQFNQAHQHYETQLKQTTQHIQHYQQHISSIERVLSDQQIQINQQMRELIRREGLLADVQHIINQLTTDKHQLALENRQLEDAILDLERRSEWLETQNKALEEQLKAIENGVVLRVLKKLT